MLYIIRYMIKKKLKESARRKAKKVSFLTALFCCWRSQKKGEKGMKKRRRSPRALGILHLEKMSNGQEAKKDIKKSNIFYKSGYKVFFLFKSQMSFILIYSIIFCWWLWQLSPDLFVLFWALLFGKNPLGLSMLYSTMQCKHDPKLIFILQTGYYSGLHRE